MFKVTNSGSQEVKRAAMTFKPGETKKKFLTPGQIAQINGHKDLTVTNDIAPTGNKKED
ncbi:hypothetical protein [Glaciecola sp. 1036]|uniref:hypothetical protein n=1 Tax=Alteromonadaceae TaxID=72275 RepID=UPI003D07765D